MIYDPPDLSPGPPTAPISCVACRGTGYILVGPEEYESFTDLSGEYGFLQPITPAHGSCDPTKTQRLRKT